MKASSSLIFFLIFILQAQSTFGFRKSERSWRNEENKFHEIQLGNHGHAYSNMITAIADSPDTDLSDINPEDWKESEPKEKIRRTKGYTGIIEVNYGAGMNELIISNYLDYVIKPNANGFKWINGYRTDEHLTVGLGLGVDAYSDLRGSGMLTFYLPITFDARFEFINSDLSPVINFNGGYAEGLSEDRPGGMLMNPSIGIRCYITANTAILINVGYKWQTLELPATDPYGYPSESRTQYFTFKFISFNIGCSF
jgi:hypothetical protein